MASIKAANPHFSFRDTRLLLFYHSRLRSFQTIV